MQTPSLTISSTTDSDSGTYRCGAQNSVGAGYSQAVSLSITGSKYINNSMGAGYSQAESLSRLLEVSTNIIV